MGSLRGIVRTCWSPCLAPLRPEASRPHAQAARWRTCRQRRPSGGSSARLRCAGRRVRRGRGGGACGYGYGGMGERERLRSELAGGHGDSAAQERRGRVREGRESGERLRERKASSTRTQLSPSSSTRWQRGAAQLGAWRTRTRRASPTGAFHRARGGRRSSQGGTPVWATSGPNWTLGQKRSLFTTSCTTTLIKTPRSLDQQIKR